MSDTFHNKKLIKPKGTKPIMKRGGENDLISQIIEARVDQNITQEELASRIGTQKSNISRLESGSYNPSLDFITKVVKGLGKEVHIEIK